MGYYLLDNPPASRQFYPSRNVPLSGGVVIHTTEGSGGFDSAEKTAGFISRRSDPGSYHCIVDSEPNAAVHLLPDDYTAFGVAQSGFNSPCWMIAIAAHSAALNPESEFTRIEIDNMGREIAEFWKRNGIDIAAASNFIGNDVRVRPGLAHHGDVQPSNRSDAWSRRPDRWIFDSLLLQAIERHAGVAPVAPPTPTVPAPVPPTSVWRVGSTGDKVRQIQKIVGVAQDGIFGPATEAAVKVWQSNLRIPADGVWGPQTEQATHDLFVFLGNLPAVEAVAPNNDFLRALDDARRQVLRQGSTGGAVKIMQAGLNGKGFALVADGIFGPATDRAVRAFQSRSGLVADGICGPRTWDALLK